MGGTEEFPFYRPFLQKMQIRRTEYYSSEYYYLYIISINWLITRH